MTYDFTKDSVMVAPVSSKMFTLADEFKNDGDGKVRSALIQTFSYFGKEGTVIKIKYYEETKEYARPPSAQDLIYDIAETDIVALNGTKVKVIEATNSYIKFIVLESPAYRYTSGAKIE